MINGTPPRCPTTVRIAQPPDEQRVYDLFMMAASENAMAPVCEANVWEAIRNATNKKGAVIGVIDGNNGNLAGAVGLVMAPFWYSKEWHCEELLNFVHPDYRRGQVHHASDLIEFAKWWANQLGMKLLMGVLTHTRTEGKVRLYRRQLPYAGALFLYQGDALNG
jgi:GNAT superfamily N-acetyltransferase